MREGRDYLSLQAVEGPCAGEVYHARTNRVTLGRTKVNNFHIKDPTVSERHAVLEWVDNQWTITDQGSSNGTSLNGEQIPEGHVTVIKNGSFLQLGSETKVKCDIMRLDDTITVEEWVHEECNGKMERLQREFDKLEQALRDELTKRKDGILAIARGA